MTSVMLYAWNPLVLTMIAGSGHIDALVAATIAATAYFVVRKNREMAAICFALSVLGKIAPIILIFLMMKRLHWKGTLLAVLVLIGMYLPYSSGGVAWRSLFFFAYTWQFNSGWFHLMERLMSFLSSDPSYAARIISGVIILALAIRLALRDKGSVESFLSAAATTLGASVVLSPTIMPWYVVGLLPLAVISKQRIWIYFSALVCLSVFMMADWRPHASVLIAEYGPFALMILFSAVLSYLARANLVHPDTLAMRYLRFSVNDDRQ
jgi:alpha-1,6-mannosyltransferase